MDKEIVDKLIAKAKEAGERAYCPYTEVPIGACVLTQNGMAFGGCNIENITLGSSLGAMEVAIAKSISEGGNNIIAVAIYCENRLPYPSGRERQLLREFGARSTVICASKADTQQFSIQELLPYACANEDM